MGKLMNKIMARNEKDWKKKYIRTVKDDTWVERYVRLVQGQESVRLLFRLRTGSAGLLEDKKRCRIVMRGV